MLFGAWLVIGVVVDGWAHNNDKPETFFTPWHGVFYSGFAVCAAWMCWQVPRSDRRPPVPAGAARSARRPGG